MASSDESVDYSSDSEAIETEIEYDLEGDPYQSETKEVYADELLADEKWRAQYEEEMKMERKLKKKLTKRLRRTKKVRDW